MRNTWENLSNENYQVQCARNLGSTSRKEVIRMADQQKKCGCGCGLAKPEKPEAEAAKGKPKATKQA